MEVCAAHLNNSHLVLIPVNSRNAEPTMIVLYATTRCNFNANTTRYPCNSHCANKYLLFILDIMNCINKIKLSYCLNVVKIELAFRCFLIKAYFMCGMWPCDTTLLHIYKISEICTVKFRSILNKFLILERSNLECDDRTD